MKSSKYLFSIIKKKNKNDINDFMIKSGIIRKFCSGLYSFLPTGKKIIDKICNLIKLEIKKINAIEISIPILQPIKLWNLSKFKNELMITKFKNKKNFVLSPTSEEEISIILNNEIKSYKQLPLVLFQIQNKFRNEIRPRCNILRTKEFIMKDAYSFHDTKKSLNKTYNNFKNIYKKIINKLNIDYFIIKTNSNFIKGYLSHEFHTISKYGEEKIIICKKTKKAEILKKSSNIYKIYKDKPKENLKIVSFNNHSYNEILNKIDKNKLIKIIICYSNNKKIKSRFIALAIKFTDSICFKKIKEINYILHPIKILDKKEEIYKELKINSETIGLINIKIPILVDYNAFIVSDFISTINNKDFIFGLNWYKDIKFKEIVDISNNKNNFLYTAKTIEICHIFKIGDKYKNDIKIQDKENNKTKVYIGSYGIGIQRLLFSSIEKNLEKKKFSIPNIISPFDIVILPLYINDLNIKKISYIIYNKLIKNNFNVLLEDRYEKNLSYLIKNIFLLGIPILLIIKKKYIDLNLIKVEDIKDNKKYIIKIEKLINFLKKYKFYR